MGLFSRLDVVSKLVIGSIACIAVGLVLVVIGNPSLRLVTGTGTTATFSTFTRTFTGGNFTGGTFPFNFTSGAPRTFAGSSRVTTANIESVAGIALVGAGLLLEVFSIFIRPRNVGAPPAAPAPSATAA